MCICVCLYICLGTTCAQCLRDQKRSLDPLGLELQMVMSTMWVLEIKSESCRRTANALSHWAMSLVQEAILVGGKSRVISSHFCSFPTIVSLFVLSHCRAPRSIWWAWSVATSAQSSRVHQHSSAVTVIVPLVAILGNKTSPSTPS